MPQVIRVVMSEWRTQFMTLRCEPHYTVDNFKEVVLKKLGKKGEVQIHMYDFYLCLEDPFTSKNKDRSKPLLGSDLLLSHYKDQRSPRLVIYLMPSLTALPAVTQAIRQSFALVSTTSQKEHKIKKEPIKEKQKESGGVKNDQDKV